MGHLGPSYAESLNRRCHNPQDKHDSWSKCQILNIIRVSARMLVPVMPSSEMMYKIYAFFRVADTNNLQLSIVK